MTINDPIERRKVVILNTSLLCVFAVFIAGGYWYGGVDLAVGTLIGCVVVAINFFVSQRLVRRLIIEKSANPVLLVQYFVKLGLSVLILFVSIVRFQVDRVGLMLGLSSIVVATVISTFFRRGPEPRDE